MVFSRLFRPFTSVFRVSRSVLSSGFRPTGLLGIALGAKLWYDFSSEAALTNGTFDQVLFLSPHHDLITL